MDFLTREIDRRTHEQKLHVFFLNIVPKKCQIESLFTALFILLCFVSSFVDHAGPITF